MTKHLAHDVLVRAMDDELLPSETVEVESHLAHCDECSRRYRQLREISAGMEACVIAISPRAHAQGRELLVRKLDSRQSEIVAPVPGQVLRRFAWGMAIAATLAVGVIFAPGRIHTAKRTAAESSARPVADTFEVNGETFLALPYSNPDLPISTSHIVQMRVPISSLTDAGVAFEPVSTQELALDHSVLADVLIGIDGQPLGVHVVSEE